MTLTTLTAQVYARLGVPTTDGTFTSTVVTGFLNDAAKQIATEHDWPWMQDFASLTVAAGDSTFTPTAATYAGTTNVLIANTASGSEVYRLTRRTYDELLEYSAVTRGRPEVWAVQFEKVHFRPLADTSYTVTHQFITTETALASGSDTLRLPVAYDPAVADLAVVLCLSRSDQDPRAVAAKARYDHWLASMLDNRRRNRRPGRVRVRPGADI